jgi:hypothetical protein
LVLFPVVRQTTKNDNTTNIPHDLPKGKGCFVLATLSAFRYIIGSFGALSAVWRSGAEANDLRFQGCGQSGLTGS